MKWLMILMLAGLISLAGCSNGEIPEVEQAGDGPIAFVPSIGQESTARLVTTTGFTSSWETNDVVGVFARRHSAGAGSVPDNTAGNNYINNVALTCTNTNPNTWALSPLQFYPPGTDQLSFYAYYPRQTSIANPNNWTFRVQEDQQGGNYNKSDLMLAKEQNKGRDTAAVTVELGFIHAMALVEAEVTNAGGSASVTLFNVKPEASVNLGSQQAGDGSGTAVDIIMHRVQGTNLFRALVPHQTIALGEQLFGFDTNNDGVLDRFSAGLAGPVTLARGTVTKYKFTLP